MLTVIAWSGMNKIAPIRPDVASAERSRVEGGANEIEIADLLRELWRKKPWIAAGALAGAALAVALVLTAESRYRSNATLIVDSQKSPAVDFEAALTGGSTEDAELNSQIEVIRSRSLMGAVVDELGLVDDPEFAPHLRDPSWFAQGLRAVGLTSPREPDAVVERERTIDELTGSLDVSIISKTYVFKLGIETDDARKSAEVVNAVAAAYIQDQIRAKVDGTGAAATWLNERVEKLEADVEEAEERLAQHISTAERSFDDAALAVSNQQLKAARGRLDTFLGQLGPDGAVTDRQRAQLARLEGEVAELSAIVEGQSADKLKANQLEREATAAAEIYTHFLERMNEIEVQRGVQEADIRILSAAIPRYERVSPRPVLTLAVGILLGTLLTALYVIARQMLATTFRSAAELRQATGLPVLAATPEAKISRLVRGQAARRQALLKHALEDVGAPLMEAIRNLRTSLRIAPGEGGTGMLVMATSSHPSEGKTTAAILLAASCAKIDKRVLLIECDLRKSQFLNYFPSLKPHGERGLPSALAAHDQGQDISPFILEEPRTGTHVILGGKSGGNAGDLLASEAFARFIESVRAAYDVVILDAPPLLPVPDARVLAPMADRVIYAVKAGATEARSVEEGLAMLASVGAPADGLILTQVSKADDAYGKGYGYGQAYGT